MEGERDPVRLLISDGAPQVKNSKLKIFRLAFS
jgi:hypothetical protein